MNWIELYKKLGHAGKVCQHYNISRFTLRKWYKRYEKLGAQGLSNFSSRPKTLPLQKINESNEQLILHLRKARKLGARRIQAELKRLHDISFALATIHKVLKKHDVSLLRIKRHYIASRLSVITAKCQESVYKWMFAKYPRGFINILL